MSEKQISDFIQAEFARANADQQNEISVNELTNFFTFVLTDMQNAENSNEVEVYTSS
jgi:hypothetical protein